VTQGRIPGDLEGPTNAIVVTTEDDPGDTEMGTESDPVPFRVPQDAEDLSGRVGETNAALVVIDALVEFIDGKMDSHKSHPVRQALAVLRQIAQEQECAVLVILHLNKGWSTESAGWRSPPRTSRLRRPRFATGSAPRGCWATKARTLPPQPSSTSVTPMPPRPI
jgi:hypothetical protein